MRNFSKCREITGNGQNRVLVTMGTSSAGAGGLNGGADAVGEVSLYSETMFLTILNIFVSIKFLPKNRNFGPDAKFF